MNNLDYFKLSLKIKEPIASGEYLTDRIVITRNANQTNKLIEANKKILKNITAYEIITGREGKKTRNKIIKDIIGLLKTKGINYSEFPNYWSTQDVSFSMYQELSNDDKRIFVKDMTEKYIKNRHDMYLSHGYTNTTLQVRCDSVAHKSRGRTGCTKVEGLVEKFGIKKFAGKNLKEFLNKNNSCYIFPDGKDKKLFQEILSKKIIKFNWTKSHQGKLPDLFVSLKGKYLVIEHKHMKESGGGQNKQMVEIIDFIKYKENGVSYLVFLDGLFFNKYAKELQKGKLKNQYAAIIKNLKNNPDNYFVNTTGFQKYIKRFVK